VQCYASAVLAIVMCMSVSLCLSVTCRYCVRMAKHRIIKTVPHDRPRASVFWCQRYWQNSNRVNQWGCQMQMG